VGEGCGEDADEEWGVTIRDIIKRIRLRVSTCKH
jgi:hypothetical protein